MHEVDGVITTAPDAPVQVERILVPDPGPGEVLIDVVTCGVCRTDEHYRTGAIGSDFPYLLGHEAAGRVAAVGADVEDLAPGDTVVLNWRAVCGSECRACRRGEPWYCFNTRTAASQMTLLDGTPLTPALGIGALAAKTIVAAGQCTPVALAKEHFAPAGLLGCGVMSGIGAVINTGALRRGETVAVIGLGGVGAGAIAGAALAGARTIIAVGRRPEPLRRALNLGATHTVNSAEVDPIDAIRDLTGGVGADLVVDAVGTPQTFRQAFYSRDLAGRAVLVGLPAAGAKWEVPLADLFSRGGAIKSSWYGDALPSRDIPALLSSYQAGKLDLDAFVSRRLPLSKVAEAFEAMRRGEVLRAVVDVSEATV